MIFLPELTSAPLALGLTALLAYLAGSIPFGVVITRAMGLGDLRQIGSGNIGATNVLRTGNKPAAAATLILDAAKGGIAVLIARAAVGEDAAQIAALASFLGHLYPVWLGFKGGKGVATFLGILLALVWPIGLLACATWAATAALTRISSASALAASALSPGFLAFAGYSDMVLLALLLAALVWIRHAANIRRMRDGTEPKIGRKTSA
ncbi:MAG: glycerol-3-phosphate 1-O-acyltransferase PlsY [Paracoccaceae bacterium]